MNTLSNEIEFQEYGKIPRFFRDVFIYEKIDGTNAQIFIYPTVTGALDFRVGSRKRWITPQDDNYGFAKWCEANRDELLKLGPGRHYGEWYGAGIQRGYGLAEKRFALFNPDNYPAETRPACCQVVPVLYRGPHDGVYGVMGAIDKLRTYGSVMVPGYMNPEGIVIWHTAGRDLYKFTFDGDGHKTKKL